MLFPPNTNSFDVLGLSIKYYGITIAIAISCSIFVLYLLCKKKIRNISFDIYADILPVLIVFGILFARLYYVILNFAYYKNHIPEIFMIWQGGLSIHGAILGGILTLFLLLKHKKVSFLNYTDTLMVTLPLAQAIGRWGNFFNQEAFGTPCNYYWCMYISQNNRPINFLNANYFHPTFLYESVFDFILFLFLLFVFLKFKNLKPGIILCLYLILYSLGRSFIEMIRIDANIFLFNLPIPVIVSALIILFSFFWLVAIYQNKDF